MEVGPLNPVRPSVEGPTEGQPGRAKEKIVEQNRLAAESANRVRNRTDSADIATRGENLRDMQRTVGISSAAREAILVIIETIRVPVEGTKEASGQKHRLEEAASKMFDGEPVLDGRRLSHTRADGRKIEVALPDGKKRVNEIIKEMRSANPGNVAESSTTRDLNKLVRELDGFNNSVKEDLKGVVGSANRIASRNDAKRVEDLKTALNQALNDKPGSVVAFKSFREMADKAVKLLK